MNRRETASPSSTTVIDNTTPRKMPLLSPGTLGSSGAPSKSRTNGGYYHRGRKTFPAGCWRYAGLASVFVAFWVVFLSQNPLRNQDTHLPRHQGLVAPRRSSAGASQSRYNPGLTGARHASANQTLAGLKRSQSLGWKIVEASYRTSGYADLATEICPVHSPNASMAARTPSRFRQNFLRDCLVRAREAGDTGGTRYHEAWPWWFRTLLRDTTAEEGGAGRHELVGRWHYLQFRGVGSSPARASGERTYAGPRMQLCVYEKGGTKSWKKLQCDHNHPDYRDAKRVDHNQCFSKQPKYDEELPRETAGAAGGSGGSNATATDNNPHRSEKVVFLRDPLDRFLSGFLDKCVRRRDRVDHCQPSSIFGKAQSEEKADGSSSSSTSESPIDSLLWDKRRTFQAYVDTFPLAWNMHFFPQSFYCGGLYRTIGEYDFVGSMGTDFYRDLGALRESYPGLAPAMGRVFPQLGKSTGSSPEAGRTNHRGVETGAAGMVREYYTPHTVRRVLEYYALDYWALGLPIPEWAEEMLRSEEEPGVPAS